MRNVNRRFNGQRFHSAGADNGFGVYGLIVIEWESGQLCPLKKDFVPGNDRRLWAHGLVHGPAAAGLGNSISGRMGVGSDEFPIDRHPCLLYTSDAADDLVSV